MSFTDTDVKAKYNGDGSTDIFAIPHAIIESANDEVEVALVDETVTPPTETIQTLTTHYTIVGPNVDFVTPPPSNRKVLISRKMVLEQPQDLNVNSAYPAAATELSLDKAIAMIQMLNEKIQRALKWRKSYIANIDPELPDPEADKVLMWDTAGTDIVNGPTADEIANAQTYANNAAASAASAATSASNAATSETNAATSETNAATSETNAAISAAAASATLASAVWNDVVFKTFADSPVTIVDGDRGKLFAFDASGGSIVVNLPQILGLTLADPWSIGVKKTDATVNVVTLNAFAGDNIEGNPSDTLTDQDQSKVLIPDTDPAPDSWSSLDSGPSQSLQSRGYHEALGTGNGVNLTFGPLAHTPLNQEDSLLVYVDGTIHDRSLWSFTGGNVVFAAAPALGQKVYCSYLYTSIAVTTQQRVEYRTLTGGEAAAKLLTLANTPVSPSLVMLDIIGGTSQEYGVDYTVAGVTLDWTGLGLDGFAPAGTKFRIHYWS